MTRTSVQRDQKAAEGRPEESVQRVQYWPWPFAFEHGDLLSEGEDFEGGRAWERRFYWARELLLLLRCFSAPLFGGPFDAILISAPHYLGDLDQAWVAKP